MSDGFCSSSLTSKTGYSLHAHAHLLGSNCVTHHDLLPSALLCVIFFGVGGGLAFKWWWRGVNQYAVLLIMSAACIITGLAFAIRAGVSNTSVALVSHVTVATEEIFLMMGELLLIDAHVTMSRDLITRWGVQRPSLWIHVNRALLFMSFILYFADFVRLPHEAASTTIPLQDTQIRIAASFFPFFLTLVNAWWLPVEKVKSPDMPWLGLGVLLGAAWFLVVPAFYAFLVAAVSADDSLVVASTTWFYVAWSLQILAVSPFLGVPLDAFEFGPWLNGIPPAANVEQAENDAGGLLEPEA